MEIGDYVRVAIDLFEAGEDEASLLMACVAVDGTARKRFPKKGNRDRFICFLRESYGTIGPMGMPGIPINTQEFPLPTEARDGGPYDLAYLVYRYYRCVVAHGDVFDPGYGLIDDLRAGQGHTTFEVGEGSVRLSNRIIFALLAAVVFAPENSNQCVPDGYHFTFGISATLPICDWWGADRRFETEVAPLEPVPEVTLDFGDWIEK